MTSGTVLAVEDLTMHYMTRAGVVRPWTECRFLSSVDSRSDW